MPHSFLTAKSFRTANLKDHAWSLLRRFHNVEHTKSIIQNIHQIEPKYIGKVQKQAEQIRYCLMQAREYRDAAGRVGLGTKPVLLYYSCLSLALAQILLKGTGTDSLDAARGVHAHHGLTFSRAFLPKRTTSFPEIAGSLSSKPLDIAGERRGTFELWHKYSREAPLVGKKVVKHLNGNTRADCEILLGANDTRLGYVPIEGLSFFDILSSLPCMFEFLEQHSLPTSILRASAEATITGNDILFALTFHPGDVATLERTIAKVKFKSDSIRYVSVVEFPQGMIVNLRYTKHDRLGLSYPQSTGWTNEEIRFLDTDIPLNEFGLFYFGLHIIGNYARYYPEMWMRDVETDTMLAHAVEQFVDFAEWQIALCTASDFSRIYWVPEA